MAMCIMGDGEIQLLEEEDTYEENQKKNIEVFKRLQKNVVETTLKVIEIFYEVMFVNTNINKVPEKAKKMNTMLKIISEKTEERRGSGKERKERKDRERRIYQEKRN